MDVVWPWLALAGMGILHGAHPANGWIWFTLPRSGVGSLARWGSALWPMAIGHAIAIAATVAMVSRGVWISGPWAQRAMGLVLVAVAAGHLYQRRGRAFGHSLPVMVALTSGAMTAAHGVGLMLVPALVPLCMAGLPASEITGNGSLLLGLAAITVHMAAMLATVGAIAFLLHAGVNRVPGWCQACLGSMCPLALGLAGIWLVVGA